MKYVMLVLLLVGALGTVAIVKSTQSLGERIAYNISTIRGEVVAAQAYQMPNSVQMERVIVTADEIMAELSTFAYGTDVAVPSDPSVAQTETTIYDMHGNWMSRISKSCKQGKQYLSKQLYSHRLSGFSYNMSDNWIVTAKKLCGA
jgi:predicted transcriptional regulator